jgi:hypothetical protein
MIYEKWCVEATGNSLAGLGSKEYEKKQSMNVVHDRNTQELVRSENKIAYDERDLSRTNYT